jgi:hypothetical protein
MVTTWVDADSELPRVNEVEARPEALIKQPLSVTGAPGGCRPHIAAGHGISRNADPRERDCTADPTVVRPS